MRRFITDFAVMSAQGKAKGNRVYSSTITSKYLLDDAETFGPIKSIESRYIGRDA